MKIIALLPVKNEAWVLPTYLSAMKKIADGIIVLDDKSTDASLEILEKAGVKVITLDTAGEVVVDMSKRRQALLNAGREAGGTHFIWLDADEVFSQNFISNGREEIRKLQPGQKMTLRWVHLWKNTSQYLDDKKSAHGFVWKDFIFCDDGKSNFESKFLSEGRTPGAWATPLVLSEKVGVVLHFQFLNGEAMYYKHAWYQCQELIEGSRSAKRINATYAVNYDLDNKLKTKPLPSGWIRDIQLPIKPNEHIWHKTKIVADFDKYGIEFFEPLKIWHLKYFQDLFKDRTGRDPIPEEFPIWILFLNKYKNKIINFYREHLIK